MSSWRDSSLPLISEVEPGLYIGNRGGSYCLEALTANKIGAMVSVLTTESLRWDLPSHRDVVSKDCHLFLQVSDSLTQDLLSHMAGICDFIDENRGRKGGTAPKGVLVHCQMGISRSATAIIAYLMRRDRLSRDAALALLKRKRKVRPNSNFMEQLAVWEETGYEIWADREKRIPKPAYAAHLSKRAGSAERPKTKRCLPNKGSGNKGSGRDSRPSRLKPTTRTCSSYKRGEKSKAEDEASKGPKAPGSVLRRSSRLISGKKPLHVDGSPGN